MIKHSPFMPTFEQLPDTLPIFPLPNAIVMPGSNLPLNIFEPRYLNMVQDAMKTHQLVGMIQPKNDQPIPEVFNIGCGGRITRYHETYDGRLEINLAGLCRFKIIEELSTTREYRLIRPDWQAFEVDYQLPDISLHDEKYLINTLKHYFDYKNMQADWKTLEKLDTDELINSMIAILPLNVEEKQSLIEAETLSERLQFFCAILESSFKDSNTEH
jgi:Lon protease-like protein